MSNRVPAISLLGSLFLRRTWLMTLICAVIVAIVIFDRARISSELFMNLSRIFLDRALWEDRITQETRRSFIQYATSFMEQAIPLESQPGLPADVDNCTAEESLLFAQQSLRDGNAPRAHVWLERAFMAPSDETSAGAIKLPGWARLSADGSLHLDWSMAGWGLRADSQSADVTQEKEGITLSYTNRPDIRDTVIYAWNWPIPTSYWNRLEFDVKVAKGTYFTFETHTTSVERHVNYLEGDNEWMTLRFPIGDDRLNAIYLSTGEPSADSTGEQYSVEMTPIRLYSTERSEHCSN